MALNMQQSVKFYQQNAIILSSNSYTTGKTIKITIEGLEAQNGSS
jgi:hypothetical protein